MAAPAAAPRGAVARDLAGMDHVIPNDMRQLRACMFCKLVKSFQQFERWGCENCPFLDLVSDRARVLKCTSGSFDGMVAMIQPNQSWVSKWQDLTKLHRGAYAIQVHGKVPEDVLQELNKGSGKRKPKSNA